MAKPESAKTVKRAMRTSQSTVYRILSTLVAEGYVAQDPQTDKYGRGRQALVPAGAALNQLEIRKQALSTLERLAADTTCNASLAVLPDADVDELLTRRTLRACTPNTITDPDLLRAELERTRLRGYAVDHEEFIQGICCVGVPVRGTSGQVIGAMSVSGSVFQVRPDREEQLAARLQDAAYEVSGRLGYIA